MMAAAATSLAFAQFSFSPGQVLTASQLISAFNQVLPLTGGTLTGNLTVPTVLASSSIDFGATLKSQGAQAMRISPSGSYNPSVFIGPNAGTSYPSANPWAVGIGAYSLFSLNQSQAEVTAVGTLSCSRLTTGNYDVCLGEHALGNDPTTSSTVAVGNDSARNEIGGGSFTAVGANAGRNGKTDMTVSVGSGALRGNASSITIGGTPKTGDVFTITMTCNAAGGCQNSPKTWTYTVKSTDTLFTIAQGICNQINSNPLNETPVNGNVLVSIQARTPQTVNDPIVSLDFVGSPTSGWQASTTVSLSSGSTETASVGTGTNASSVVVLGTFAADGAAVQNLSNSNFIGMGVAPRLTNATEENCIGHWSCFSLNNGNDTTAVGEQAMSSNQSGNFNTAVGAYAGYGVTGNSSALYGSYAGYGITTGSFNTVVGDYAGDNTSRNCITTGSSNVELGRLACVPSATSNGQLSIQNAIYGYANNGAGSTPSTGFIGIYQPSPIAMLDVKGVDTSGSTYAFRVNDTNNSTLFSVMDSGEVTAKYLDNTPIGSNVQASGAFTALSASGTVSGAGFSNYLASPPAIGGTSENSGAFTALSASGSVSGSGFSSYLASPPAIGGSSANTGAFTGLSASGTVAGAGFSNYLASPPAIGGTAANAAAFTTLSASGTVSGAGFTSLLSPYALLSGTTFSGATTVRYSNASFTINDSSGTNQASLLFQSNGVSDWFLSNTSSSGAFCLNRIVAGSFVDNPICASNSTGVVTIPDGLTLKGTPVLPNLSGTTGSIGGSALAAGACTSGTVSVSNAATSMAVQATPATYPGDGFWWEGYTSATGTVTVKVCASAAGTPTASAYNVRVMQ